MAETKTPNPALQPLGDYQTTKTPNPALQPAGEYQTTTKTPNPALQPSPYQTTSQSTAPASFQTASLPNTPGLLDSGASTPAPTPGVPVTGYTPALAAATPSTATGYDPNAFAVTSDQTVQGQLANIVGKDSPLIQQADTRAKQEGNARGLLNSSMTEGAREAAVIGSALPIAQQDAGTYNKAMTDTTNAQNTAKQFGAGAENTASGLNAQLETGVSQGNQAEIDKAFATTVNNITQLTNTKMSNETQLAMNSVDNETKNAIAVLGAQNANLLQASTSAANAFQETVKNIAAIAVDATLSPQAKKKATQTQMNLMNQLLQTIGGISSTVPAAVTDLNLGQYFQPADTTPTPAAPGATPAEPPYTGYQQGGPAAGAPLQGLTDPRLMQWIQAGANPANAQQYGLPAQ